MLDIRILRDDPESVKKAVKTRGGNAFELVDQVLACDEERRTAETECQALQGDRNRISKEIGTKKKAGEDTSEIEAEVREIGKKIAEISARAESADTKQSDLLLQIPNLPHDACPVGLDETSNPEIRKWGEPEQRAEEGREDHVAICERLGLVDFEAAGKISGSGYAVFTGPGARLERALIQFLLDLHTREHGYQEVSPPFVVRRECMFGTGQLPKFEEDMFGLEDGAAFLVPTAEVPVTNLLREQILKSDQLPVKLTAYTPCFRREAGSAGRESRGLIRMHQFDKIELVKVVHPEAAAAELESLTADAEKVLQLLELPYRVIELCTGDLGFSAAKTYDIEVWAPGHGGFLEVSSCSHFGDYQARRMKLRFKDENGKNLFCHTLNGSGTALPRLFVALVETHLQPDGTIAIPEPLQPYFGSDRIG